MKKTLNQEFLSEVTFEPTYPRPSFTLPDLSGPDGNTFVLASKIYDTLRDNDFYPEATLLCGGANYNFFMAKGPSHSALIFKTKAEEHANLISLFVALENNSHDVYDEDEDYVYIKQKKQKPVRNLPLFKQFYLGNSCFITMSRIFDKELKSLTENNIQNLVEILATVVNIAPETSENLLGEAQLKSFLKTTPYYEKAVSNNHKEEALVLTIQSQIEQKLMELSLPEAQKQTLKFRL